MGVILSQPHQREVVTCQHGFLLSSSLAHWPLQPSLRSPLHLKMTATWKERRTRREQSTMSFQQTFLNTESGTLTSSEWENEVRTSLVLEREVHTSLGLGKEVRMSSESGNEVHMSLESGKGALMSLA